MTRLAPLRAALFACAWACACSLGACATAAPVADTAALPGRRLGPTLRAMRVPLHTVSAQKEGAGGWQNVLFKVKDAEYCVALRPGETRTRREPSLLSDGHGFRNSADNRLLRAHIEAVSVHREGKLEHFGAATTRYCQPSWGYPYGE